MSSEIAFIKDNHVYNSLSTAKHCITHVISFLSYLASVNILMAAGQ